MPRQQHLVIFARVPRLGVGKRRLAADIGDVAAWAFYRATLTKVVRRLARDSRWVTWIALTPDNAWLPHAPKRVRVRPQGRGDLGARMGRVLQELTPGPVVIVGSDIPDLKPEHIAVAFRELGRKPFVLGPADDGGYWLAGAQRVRALPRSLFRNVRWSTSYALADTMAGLPVEEVGLLPIMLDDIDDGAAYRRWLSRKRH